jgi:hypothetical protein
MGQPGVRRVGGDAEDVDAAGGVLDDEERVQPTEGDGVDMKQVAGQDPERVGSKELGPRGAVASGEGSIPALCKICPDGGGADLVAEAGEFAVDASISPGGILGRQSEGETAEAGGDGGSPRSPSLGPAAGDESLMPARDRRGCDE